MGPAVVLAPRGEEAGRHAALPNSSGAPPGLRVGPTGQAFPRRVGVVGEDGAMLVLRECRMGVENVGRFLLVFFTSRLLLFFSFRVINQLPSWKSSRQGLWLDADVTDWSSPIQK